MNFDHYLSSILFFYIVIEGIQCNYCSIEDENCKRSDLGLLNHGKEYKFHVDFTSRSRLSSQESFGTGFQLEGELLVTSHYDTLEFQLSGIDKSFSRAADGDLFPSQLLLPFAVEVSQGKFQNLSFHSDDSLWSKNLKKGISSVFQLESSSLVGPDYGKIMEQHIFGTCEATFVRSSGILVKHVLTSTCNDFPKNQFRLWGTFGCPFEQQESIYETNEVIYSFADSDYQSLILIEVKSSIALQLFQPQGTTVENIVSGKFRLVEVREIGSVKQESISLGIKESLRFTFTRSLPGVTESFDQTETEDTYFTTLTGVEQQKLQKLIYDGLAVISQSENILPEEENFLNGDTYVQLQNLASRLDLESLRNIYQKIRLDGNVRRLFIQIVQTSGSNPSALFLMETINNATITWLDSQRAMSYFPYYLRTPNEFLLRKYAEFLDRQWLDSEGQEHKINKWSFWHSLAHLIHVTCGSGSCSAGYEDEMGQKLLSLFKDSTNPGDQVAALIALRNARIPTTFEPIREAVLDKSLDGSVRFYGLNALKNIGTKMPHRSKLVPLCFSIFTDPTEPTDLRIMAFAGILYTRPSPAEIDVLISFVVREDNREIRSAAIATMRSFAYSKNPCVVAACRNIKYLLRDRLKRIKSSPFLSNNLYTDFTNLGYGFSGSFQISPLYEKDPDEFTYAFRSDYKLSDNYYLPIEVFLRFRGYSNMTKRLQGETSGAFRFEMHCVYRGYVIMYLYFNEKDFESDKFIRALPRKILSEIRTTLDSFRVGSTIRTWRPNILGIPIEIGVGLPTSISFRDEFLDGRWRTNLDSRMQTVFYIQQEIYNGSFQYVSSTSGSRLWLPISGKFQLNLQNPSLYVTFIPTTLSTSAVISASSKVTTGYLWGQHLQLARNSEQSEQSFEGYQGFNGILRSDGCLISDIFDEISDLQSPGSSNDAGDIFGRYLIYLEHLHHYFWYFPRRQSCFTSLTIETDKLLPSLEINISLRKEADNSFKVNFVNKGVVFDWLSNFHLEKNSDDETGSFSLTACGNWNNEKYFLKYSSDIDVSTGTAARSDFSSFVYENITGSDRC
ncbi:vitellogenin-1-like [Artemia franciscana]